VSKFYAFAELPNAPARATFAASGALIMQGQRQYEGEVFVAERAGRACAVASCDDDRLAGMARQGKLSLVADVNERGGVSIIQAVWLVINQGSSAWATGQPRNTLSSACREWQPCITLASMQRGNRQPLQIPASARRPGEDVCRLEISGEITDQSVRALICDIERAQDQTLYLSIDSPGGELAAGKRLYRAATAHNRLVMTHTSGQASSAAALVFLAGDVRSVDHDATIMVHRPYVTELTKAEADDLRSLADQLDGTAEEISAILAARSGIDLDIAREWVSAGTYFAAGQALSVGIVHQVCYDQAPLVPQARRVRTAPINGPYQSARTSASGSQPALLEYGRTYARGTVLRCNGKTFRAKREATPLPGSLSPELDSVLWERM